MKTLTEQIYESLSVQPKSRNGKIKIMALVSDGYLSDNLDLTSGFNNACLLFAADSPRGGYITVNGLPNNSFRTLRDIEKVIGKQPWKDAGEDDFDYAHRGATTSNDSNVKLYTVTIDKKIIDDLYNSDKVFVKYHWGFSTSHLKNAYMGWEDMNYIEN